MTIYFADMENSRAAHESVKPHKPRIHQQIMDTIFTYKSLDLTAEDIAILNGMHPSQIFKRMSELEDAGKIKKDGSKVGRTGRKQTIWRAV